MASSKQWLFRIFVGPFDPWMFKKEEGTPTIAQPLKLPVQDQNPVIGVVFGTVRITKPILAYAGNLEIKRIQPTSGGKK